MNGTQGELESANRTLRNQSLIWITVAILLFVTNFGLGLQNLSLTYALYARFLFIARFLLPTLAVVMVLRCPGFIYRAIGLLIFSPVAALCLVILITWTSFYQGRIFCSPTVKEELPGLPYVPDSSEKRVNTNGIFVLALTDSDHPNMALFQFREFGPAFTQQIASVDFPENYWVSFLPQVDDTLSVQVRKYEGEKDKFVMTARVEEFVSGRVKVAP
ncbi:hypothetical protein BH11CYA1_BH11CYA1_46910 [soil metagenome]